jgi:hypothetical protein
MTMCNHTVPFPVYHLQSWVKDEITELSFQKLFIHRHIFLLLFLIRVGCRLFSYTTLRLTMNRQDENIEVSLTSMVRPSIPFVTFSVMSTNVSKNIDGRQDVNWKRKSRWLHFWTYAICFHHAINWRSRDGSCWWTNRSSLLQYTSSTRFDWALMWIKGRGRKTASLNQSPKTWKRK